MAAAAAAGFSLLTVRRGGVRRIVLATYKNAFICIQAVTMLRAALLSCTFSRALACSFLESTFVRVYIATLAPRTPIKRSGHLPIWWQYARWVPSGIVRTSARWNPDVDREDDVYLTSVKRPSQRLEERHFRTSRSTYSIVRVIQNNNIVECQNKRINQ